MSWHKVKLKTLLSQPVQNGYSPVCPEEPNGKWILGLGALSDFGLDTTQIKPAPVDDSKVDNFGSSTFHMDFSMEPAGLAIM
ncbi:hypothetical protein [Thiolapillus sp.]|uniref:hypothetical protein n=1 Tax=Thiolapillus sp. TaxID=2017437 RepID=UPI003AF6E80B